MESCEFKWTPDEGWQGIAPEIAADAQLVIFFASRVAMAEGSLFRILKARFPNAIVAGNSGGGQIHGDGIVDHGLTGVAMSFDKARARIATSAIADSFASHEAGRNLARSLVGPDLKGVYILADGLDVNGDQLMQGMNDVLPPHVVVGGGMAADDDRFERTVVAANAAPERNMIAAIGFYGDSLNITSGVGSGWKEAGAAFEITASRDNKLYDLNGQPALSVYEQHLGADAARLPMSGLNFPLNVCSPQNQNVKLVRTLLGIDRDVGMMTFAGNVPEGWMAQLMHAAPLDLIEAAQNAAKERQMDALANAQVTLLVSCIGRRLVLGNRSAEEVRSVKSALAGSPAIAGFYSYGEFATGGESKRPQLFNQTLTAFSISEAA